jgi:hypothetical protein
MVQSKDKLVDELPDRGSNGEEADCVLSDEAGTSHGNFFEAQQDEIPSP